MGTPYVLTVTSGAVGLADIPEGGAALDLATVPCFCAQTTEATLTPTANTTDVPATLCSPASTRSVLSSWALTFNSLQDWGRTDTDESLSEWLYEHDGGEAIAVLYLEDGQTVKAVARVSVVAGQYGGPGGETLLSTTSLPVTGTPDIYKGAGEVLKHGATGSSTPTIPITGDLDCSDDAGAVSATGFDAPVAGLVWTLAPSGAVYPATVTSLVSLKSDPVLGDAGTGAPSRDFTVGEYIVGPGSSGDIHYTAGAWASGAA